MPRNKKREASSEESGSASDSDSGPEKEEKKPPAKKTKSDSGSSSRVEDAAEPTWKIDKMRFVKVRDFKGRTFIDIREFYEKDGDMLPGKKGISLTAAQYQKLKEIIPEVDDALKDI